MIELGKVQELTVVKKVDFGVYLGEKMDAGQEERVLLPKKKSTGRNKRRGQVPGVYIQRFF